MEEKEIFCQSCHMPIYCNDDKGTNADKSISEDYCTHCLRNGEFVGYCTVEEAIADSVNFAENNNKTPQEMLEYAQRVYPTLKRWKNKK